MSVLLLFFDGVGIAPPDPTQNPITEFINRPFPVAGEPYDCHAGQLFPADACLGVDGLPQSATGQATILTGKNAPRIQGRHVTAYPTTKLRALITEHSLFKQVRDSGMSPVFANAYHPGYFARRHTRYSVSTWSWLAAGIDYNSLDDLRAGRAVSHDLTNRFLNGFGFSVPLRHPAQAGRILAEMLERHDFILFEYILTDVFGHSQDRSSLLRCLSDIAKMTEVLLTSAALDRHTILLVSDHGNAEDLSTNTHNRNPVPVILWGGASSVTEHSIRSLTDISPAVLRILRNGNAARAL